MPPEQPHQPPSDLDRRPEQSVSFMDELAEIETSAGERLNDGTVTNRDLRQAESSVEGELVKQWERKFIELYKRGVRYKRLHDDDPTAEAIIERMAQYRRDTTPLEEREVKPTDYQAQRLRLLMDACDDFKNLLEALKQKFGPAEKPV